MRRRVVASEAGARDMRELPALHLEPFPEIDLRHMLVLTDETGMLQHARFATPDLHHGYCTDDVARAAITAVMALGLGPEAPISDAAGSAGKDADVLVALQRYLASLAYAFNPQAGRFRNFMGYDRRWLEEVGSEDSHGRAVWALGVVARLGPNDSIRELAGRLLHEALPAVEPMASLRPLAFGLLGIDEYLQDKAEDELASRVRVQVAGRLFARWRAHATEDWPWWEDRLTWGNAKLPHALVVSGSGLGRPDMVQAGLTALRWLLAVQTAKEGHLSVIGNKGWFVRGGAPARFDQQPIEAQALVQACLAAAVVTRDAHWTKQATRCFEWFLGRNDVGVPLYDPQTGGCQNGLTPDGANPNQGAESTLAYLLSVLELHRYRRMQSGQGEAAPS